MRRLANEPALVVAVILGVFSAASSYFLDVGSGIDVNTALGKAFGLFGLSGAAGALIRQLVYGPQTANEIMDADKVIAAAEAEGRG